MSYYFDGGECLQGGTRIRPVEGRLKEGGEGRMDGEKVESRVDSVEGKVNSQTA